MDWHPTLVPFQKFWVKQSRMNRGDVGAEFNSTPCLDNPIEQDHRGIKPRYYPMLGFGAFESAKRFCAVFEEVRQYLRTLCVRRRHRVPKWQNSGLSLLYAKKCVR